MRIRLLLRRIRFLALMICIFVSSVSSQTRSQDCFGAGSIQGYKSIEDLNLDMQDIVASGNVTGSFVFTFCPITTFFVVEPLRPLLSDTLFVCGAGGSPNEECIFDGGQQQVVLEGDLFNVTIFGVDFQNFENTSILGNASTNSTVLFDRCNWRRFLSPFVVDIVPDSPENDAMIMVIRESSITDGVGDSIISNDGGLLQIENLTASGLVAAGLVVSGNFAETNINMLQVIGNELTYVAFATLNSAVTIVEGFISENTQLSEVFFVTDNSELAVETSSVVFNQIERTEEEGGWSIGSARGINSTLGMNNMLIEGNTNVQFISSSDTESSTFLTDSLLMGNTGMGTSALVFAVNSASFTVERVLILDNSDFTFNFFAFNESFVTFRENCMIGGSAGTAAFMGEATQYVATGNFIDNLQTMGCQAPGPRLFKEDAGARCFNGGTNCSGTCEIMADATECIINGATATPTVSETPAPSIVPTTTMPTVIETQAPSSGPGTPGPSLAPVIAPTVGPGTPGPSLAPIIAPTVGSGEPTSPPNVDPTSSPLDVPSLPPMISPGAPPISIPTEKPIRVMRKPLPPKPHPMYYAKYRFGTSTKSRKSPKSHKSKTSKTKGHHYWDYSKVSKGYYDGYSKSPKGSKYGKGYANDYQPPPHHQNQHGDPWQQPQHKPQYTSMNNHDKGNQDVERHRVGSNHHRQNGNNNSIHKRSSTATANTTPKVTVRSSGNQGTITGKRLGLRPQY